MTRRPRMTGMRLIPAATMLLGSLWLSGCATQTSLSGGSDKEAAEAYTRLGIAYLERDNLSRAMNALGRALEMNPRDAQALQAMAMVHQRQGGGPGLPTRLSVVPSRPTPRSPGHATTMPRSCMIKAA